MTYAEFKEKQRKEFEAFPMFFAFNQKQLDDGLKKLNVTVKEIYRLPGGGFIRKTDSKAFGAMLDKLDKEKKNLLSDPKNLTNAIEYELANHEYCFTCDETEALEAVGVKLDSEEKIECFKKARQRYMASCTF